MYVTGKILFGSSFGYFFYHSLNSLDRRQWVMSVILQLIWFWSKNLMNRKKFTLHCNIVLPIKKFIVKFFCLLGIPIVVLYTKRVLISFIWLNLQISANTFISFFRCSKMILLEIKFVKKNLQILKFTHQIFAECKIKWLIHPI